MKKYHGEPYSDVVRVIAPPDWHGKGGTSDQGRKQLSSVGYDRRRRRKNRRQEHTKLRKAPRARERREEAEFLRAANRACRTERAQIQATRSGKE
jgi:hypothetical protein